MNTTLFSGQTSPIDVGASARISPPTFGGGHYRCPTEAVKLTTTYAGVSALHRAFNWIHRILAARRLSLVAGVLLCLAFCFYRAGTMTPNEDITLFLPDDRVVDEFRLVVSRFHQQDQLFFDVGLSEGSPDNAAAVAAAADALYDHLAGSKLFAAIRYRMTPEQGLAILDYLDRQKPWLFAAADVAPALDLVRRDRATERLADAQRRLLEPEGIFLKDAVRHDPLELRSIFLAKLAALQAGTDVVLRSGRMWSHDDRHVVLITEPVFPSTDALHSEQLFGEVRQACAAAEAASAGTSVQIRYAGGHRGVMDNRAMVRRDMWRATLLSMLGICALVYFGFRRRLLALLCFLPVLFGFMAAVAVFSFFTDRASLVIFGSASIFAGLTIDYAIYTLYRCDHLDETLWPDSLGFELYSLANPLLLGASTTAAAFLSLLVSALPGQRQLGAFSAIGVMGAVLFAMFALPHLLPGGGIGRRRHVLPLAVWLGRLLDWLPKRRAAVALLVVALTAVTALGLPRLKFDGDLRNLNGLMPETLRDETAMLAQWGGVLATTAVVVRGQTMDAALEANEKLAGALNALMAQKLIRSFVSIAPVLPSAQQALANCARWSAFWNESRRHETTSTVSGAAVGLGFSPEAFAPFFGEIAAAARPEACNEDRRAALGGPLAELLKSNVANDAHETLVLTRMEAGGDAQLAAATAQLRAQFPSILIVNGRAMADHTAALVAGSLSKLALVSFVAVTLLLFLFLRRPGHVVAVLVPVGFDILWTLGTLGLCGVAINLMNCLFIGLVFGVSSDYAIFLAAALRDGKREHVGVTGGAVILCALTTLCGFGVLALARHPVLFAMGITTLVGVAFGMVAAVLCVPLLVHRRPDSCRKFSA